MTLDELKAIKIDLPNKDVSKRVKQRLDSIAKPLDGLGRFENVISDIGGILGTEDFSLFKKAVIVMCADNGIVDEKISQSTQEVTYIVSQNMVKGITSVCKMADIVGAKVMPVDIGINNKNPIEGIIHKKVSFGTKNFLKEPAMSEEKVLEAIEVGIELVKKCKLENYEIIATGEMGIGNTTTSSAVAAAITGCDVEKITGRGAGLSDERLLNKCNVIKNAIEKYNLKKSDAFTILRCVGGLDIAGLVGVFIGGGVYKIPIVIDGVISAAAALAAENIVPGIKNYVIPSHKSKEPAADEILKAIGVTPFIDAQMSLGEGTGAVMMLGLLDMAMAIYNDKITFGDINMEQYERFDGDK